MFTNDKELIVALAFIGQNLAEIFTQLAQNQLTLFFLGLNINDITWFQDSKDEKEFT